MLNLIKVLRFFQYVFLDDSKIDSRKKAHNLETRHVSSTVRLTNIVTLIFPCAIFDIKIDLSETGFSTKKRLNGPLRDILCWAQILKIRYLEHNKRKSELNSNLIAAFSTMLSIQTAMSVSVFLLIFVNVFKYCPCYINKCCPTAMNSSFRIDEESSNISILC